MITKYRLLYSIPVILFIFFIETAAFAQVLDSPLTYHGGPDAHVFKSDTTILENAYIDDGPSHVPSDTVITGISFLHSPYASMLFFPVAYQATSRISMGVTLPFITRTYVFNSVYFTKCGYGDAQYFIAVYNKFDLFKARLYLKGTLPTGDAAASDGGNIIPMGYGSFTFSGLLSVSTNKFMTMVPTRVFFNVGLVYYTESIRDIGSSLQYTYDSCYSITSLFGMEFRLVNRLYFQVKANVIYMPERSYTFTDSSIGSTSDKLELNDALLMSDAITSLKYRFLPDITTQLMFIYPVFSSVDSDVSGEKDREMKFFFNLEKKFGSQFSNRRSGK